MVKQYWVYSYSECYSAIRRNEVLMRATVWMNPGNMVGEGNQKQKATFCIIPLKLKVKNWQIYGDIE